MNALFFLMTVVKDSISRIFEYTSNIFKIRHFEIKIKRVKPFV